MGIPIDVHAAIRCTSGIEVWCAVSGFEPLIPAIQVAAPWQVLAPEVLAALYPSELLRRKLGNFVVVMLQTPSLTLVILAHHALLFEMAHIRLDKVWRDCGF